MAANALDEQGYQVPLTVLVDKERNRVVYAESGNDFVDVLLSFLTLPLGTIARLVAVESNIEAVEFGSLSKLYQSVSELDEKCLWNQTCKQMLLKPRNSMEAYCKKMKLNIDETARLMFFYCKDDNCTGKNGLHASTLRDQRCICGKMLNVEVTLDSPAENGFVKETCTFIISDDLCVMPNILGTSLNIFQKLGINDIDVIDKQTVHFSKSEVIDLLKLSLTSKTPLSDVIFKKDKFVGNLDPRNRLEFWTGEVDEQRNESNKMSVKILPIDVESSAYSISNKDVKLVNPKSPSSGGFVNGPMSFMVTDDLVVSPMSSISGLEYLKRMKVPLNDVEERVISIGLKEGLSILKASLTSTSSFTNGLSFFVTQQFSLEKF
ncbi:uncharacterized protein LOC127131214 [Lathyrus oleraceus]|uniref:uncharacterized protein LOC127131214 n=1 Tax=Pisum sativum TaxID=3888 RepID=UPI0021D35657|nr:uncharacterized protein LOC127131214 [Pisum sativum]